MAEAKINEQGRDFVQKVMNEVGAENAVQLAEMLYGPNVTITEVRRVGRWASGRGGAPNMQGTLDLLRLAGRLVEPSEKKSASRRSLDDEALRRVLWDLAELQERQDELLFGLLDREIARRAPQRPAERKTKKATAEPTLPQLSRAASAQGRKPRG